jgi:hypothetical protein
MDKATVQLAANAHDPAIRHLVVDLLNDLQPEVDACHSSQSGLDLKKLVDEKAKIRVVAKHARIGSSTDD